MKLLPAKSIMSAYSKGDSWFGSNYGINLYKGCSHGCIYCDSRSHCYRIENFDEVKGKQKALKILEKELATIKRKGIVANGAMSDPYNPEERKHLFTQGALKLLNKYRYGASVLTKSSLIVRDKEVLKQISSHSPVVVKFTITSFNDNLCEKIEPNVVPSSERFKALSELAKDGLFTGLHSWPILPFINDGKDNIRQIVKAAATHAARFVHPYFGVTLRQN